MASTEQTTYLEAIKMLARRELSEAQLRERLRRRQHPSDAIDTAIERLRDERAIDDRRVAEVIARTQFALKHRGRLRVRLEIERAGIAAAIARQVTDEVFGAVDPDAQVEASLEKRLRGRERIADQAEFNRLYRYLIGQGFEPEAVLRALKKRGGGEGRMGR